MHFSNFFVFVGVAYRGPIPGHTTTFVCWLSFVYQPILNDGRLFLCLASVHVFTSHFLLFGRIGGLCAKWILSSICTQVWCALYIHNLLFSYGYLTFLHELRVEWNHQRHDFGHEGGQSCLELEYLRGYALQQAMRLEDFGGGGCLAPKTREFHMHLVGTVPIGLTLSLSCLGAPPLLPFCNAIQVVDDLRWRWQLILTPARGSLEKMVKCDAWRWLAEGRKSLTCGLERFTTSEMSTVGNKSNIVLGMQYVLHCYWSTLW